MAMRRIIMCLIKTWTYIFCFCRSENSTWKFI